MHQTSEDVDVNLLGCTAVTTCWQMPTFQRNIISLTLGPKTVAVCFIEPLVYAHKSKRRYKPEDQYRLLSN